MSNRTYVFREKKITKAQLQQRELRDAVVGAIRKVNAKLKTNYSLTSFSVYAGKKKK